MNWSDWERLPVALVIIGAWLVLIAVLAGCGGSYHVHCDGTTRVYTKAHAIDVVPNDPRCAAP